MSETPRKGSAQRDALVTGAAAGIGRAEAIALAEAGADVAVLGPTDLAGAEEPARRGRALGRGAAIVQAAVRQPGEVRRYLAVFTPLARAAMREAARTA